MTIEKLFFHVGSLTLGTWQKELIYLQISTFKCIFFNATCFTPPTKLIAKISTDGKFSGKCIRVGMPKLLLMFPDVSFLISLRNYEFEVVHQHLNRRLSTGKGLCKEKPCIFFASVGILIVQKSLKMIIINIYTDIQIHFLRNFWLTSCIGVLIDCKRVFDMKVFHAPKTPKSGINFVWSIFKLMIF